MSRPDSFLFRRHPFLLFLTPLGFWPFFASAHSAWIESHKTLTMLSRRIAATARMASLRPMRHPHGPLVMLPAMMQTARSYADKVVKVPQMAESISEGTLKQFSKGIGEYVEQDEEIATIETDKVSACDGQ